MQLHAVLGEQAAQVANLSAGLQGLLARSADNQSKLPSNPFGDLTENGCSPVGQSAYTL